MVAYPFTVIPLVGFEFARFGESRAEHRTELGPFESWQRDPESAKVTDLYLDTLMSLDYDDDDRLEFIEIINDEAEVYVEDVQFVNRPVEEISRLMADRGHEVVGPYVGVYAIPSLGIRFTTTRDDETGRKVTEGISLVPKETIPELLERR
jgi:hypothetical protein